VVSYRHFGTSWSVRNYNSTLRKIPKQRISHFYVAAETDEVTKSSSFRFVLKSVADIRRRKANWIGHILRRNCLLQQVIEGKITGGIEVTGRRGRKRRKLLDDLKERKGCSQLKEEALDRTMWSARFGRGFGPVVRQTERTNTRRKLIVVCKQMWRYIQNTCKYPHFACNHQMLVFKCTKFRRNNKRTRSNCLRRTFISLPVCMHCSV